MAANREADAEAAAYGVGWKIFTGSMLILSAIFTLIFSVIAISDASWFRTVVGPDVRLPTESIAPAHRSLCSGLPASANRSRSTTYAAPSARR